MSPERRRATRTSPVRAGSTRRGRVVGLGLCVLDHLYVVDSDDFEAERLRYRERLVSFGGMVANALVQAAALGCEAHILSQVGDDAEGRLLRSALSRAGVVTRRLLGREGHATGLAVMLVDRGSGARRFLVADRRPFEHGAADFDLGPLREDCVLLVDGHFPAQARRALRRARVLGARVVADFNQPTPAALSLMRWVDYPVVPFEFARAYGGTDPAVTLRRLRDDYGGEGVVTAGERGGFYLEGDRLVRYPALRARVRDTTGAGDAFHGAFAAALCHGADLSAAIAEGARAGARCCGALGATGHLQAPEQHWVGARRQGSR